MANVGGVIFGADQPVVDDNSDNTVYCMGTLFTSDVAGTIPQIHWRVPNGMPGQFNSSVLPIQAQLWKRSTSDLIQTATWGTLLPVEWNHLTVNWPIEAGFEYIYSIVTDRYVATTQYFNASKTNGHITAPFQAGLFHDLGTIPGAKAPYMPDTQYNSGAYFLDIDFVPQSASGPTLKVWNGSAEVASTITIWNGSAEVAASLSAIA